MNRRIYLFGFIGFFLLNLIVSAVPPSNCVLTWVIDQDPMKDYIPHELLIQRYFILDDTKMRVDKVIHEHIVISTIYRKDLNLIWNLNPPDKKYTEIPFHQEFWDEELIIPTQKVINRSEKIGETKYLGLLCDIYENRTTEKEEESLVARDSQMILKFCVKDQGKLVLKLEAKEFRMIKPSASLFELPIDYQKK